MLEAYVAQTDLALTTCCEFAEQTLEATSGRAGAQSICNVCETPHMPRLFLSDAHVPSVILLNRCRCDTAHEAQGVNHCLVTHCEIVSREATRPMDHFRAFPRSY